MRVLHLIPNMGGGGAERELAHLAGATRGLGTDVHVALSQEGPNYERLAGSGATIHRIAVAGNHDPRLFLALDRIVREVRPDLIQTWLTQMDIAGGWIANRRGLPWILSERASARFYGRAVKNRLRIAIARRAALIQANSLEGTKYWESVIPHARTRFVPSPVPVDEIDATPPADAGAMGKIAGVPFVLFAGRFHEQKNIHNMLQAMAHVLRVRPAVLALCGQGAQDADVRRWLNELGIAEHVRLPGYVDTIWAWMKAADVFVSVSHFEGRPNTVVEAAAARCPLVVSDIPEHREFLEPGRHALIVDRTSPEAIAAAIHQTLDERERSRGRAEAAYRVVADWTPRRIASVHAAIYEEVLARASASIRDAAPSAHGDR